MLQVMGLQLHEPLVVPIQVMERIMEHVIYQIAEYRARKKWGYKYISDQRIVEEIKSEGKGNAQGWGHHQTHGIIGVVVMYPVDDEHDAFAKFRFWMKVENVTVKEVFQNRPSQNTTGKQTDNLPPNQGRVGETLVQEITDYGNVNEERYTEVDF